MNHQISIVNKILRFPFYLTMFIYDRNNIYLIGE